MYVQAARRLDQLIQTGCLQQQQKKRGRDMGWSQAANESIMAIEKYIFDSLQLFSYGKVLVNYSLRQRNNVSSVSGSAGLSTYIGIKFGGIYYGIFSSV